jgi:SAM-dependent methyltransferase
LWLWTYPGWQKHYYGCDVDAEAISWLKSQGQTQVTTCGDLPPLPYQDTAFGGLFAFSVLTHIHPEQHQQWYKEVHRVLLPGGTVYITHHGASIACQSGMSKSISRQFDQQGWAWLQNEGHYKSASMVSEAFTRQSLEGLFTVENFTARGYQNQDAYLLRRLP